MTPRTLTIANAVAILFILAIAICLSTKARAYDEDWIWKESRATNRAHCQNYGIDAACAYKTPWRVRQAKRRAWLKYQEDLRGYRHARREHYYEPEIRRARVWREEAIDHDRYDDREERGRHCQPKLSVVGDQYASEQGAQEEANKAWMQTSRWAYGERYMARDHAIEATYECGRSSVGSVVGQVFYRCRLTARPCSAPKTRAN